MIPLTFTHRPESIATPMEIRFRKARLPTASLSPRGRVAAATPPLQLQPKQ